MLAYTFLTNSEDIEAALDYLLAKHTPICIDTETDGLSRFRKVIGIGLSADENESFYIPILIWKDGALISPWQDPNLIFNKLKWFFNLKACWIGHNITFDAIAIENLTGVNITPNIHCDTQSLAHLVYNEEGPLGLKPLSSELFNLKAEESQDEVKESVKQNGGKITKGKGFELYKANWDIIGKYCCYDCHFTYRIYNKLYPEIEKQGFSEIWNKEVLPLSKVTYELNREGFTVDINYFNKLKIEITEKICELEKEIMLKIEPHIQEYVESKVKEEIKVTPRSALGRQLIKDGLAEVINKELKILDEKTVFELMKAQYASKKPLFNLDSGDDKAFLIYDVLQLPCSKTTESGKRSTDAKTIDELCEQYEGESETLKLLKHRAKERKILSTYIEPILENAINGKIYTSFRQTGTISGRYSSSDPINFQNLPRDDKRIKKGFIPKKGNVIIGSDYESAEPKAFAFVSGEQKIKDIFIKGHDFYSTIAIDTEDLEGVSADPKSENYLKNVDPAARQAAKAYCFTGDTYVRTQSSFKLISNLKIGDSIEGGIVSDIFKRESQTMKFITSKGAFRCTLDHPIFSKTKNKFIKASDFEIGEEIEFCQSPIDLSQSPQTYVKLPIFSQASLKNTATRPMYDLTFDENWAWQLGAFLGDGIGSYSKRKGHKNWGYNTTNLSVYIGICGLEIDGVVEPFLEFFRSLGYKETATRRISKKSGDFVQAYIRNLELVHIFESAFEAIIKADEENEKWAHKNLRIQQFIFESPISVRLAFLAGLLDTDGYTKKLKKYPATIQLCTKHYKFASDIHNLLTSLNAEATLTPSYNKTYNKNYYLISLTIKGRKQLCDLGLSQYMKCKRKREVLEASSFPRFKTPPVKCKTIVREITLDAKIRCVYDLKIIGGNNSFYASNILVHNCLGIAYGMRGGRLSSVLNIEYMDAQDLVDRYLDTYPKLHAWMKKSESDAMRLGYVKTIFGRKRRSHTVHDLWKKYGITDFSKKSIQRLVDKNHIMEDSLKLYLKCNNNLNNAKNFQIQGICASIINKAMLEFQEKRNLAGCPNARIIMMVHDEIILTAPKEEANTASMLLKECMENNEFAKRIDVKMKADPVITDKSLAEAK